MRNRQTCDIRLQVVSQTRGPNLWDLHCRHAALPDLQDGVGNSDKAYCYRRYIHQLSNQQPKKISEEIRPLSVIGELDKLLMD